MRARTAAAAGVAGLGLALAATMSAGAADVEIGSGTGDVITEIANATRELRLASVPADLRVRSDSMVFDYGLGELAYKGNVRVAQGGVYLKSDELIIAFEPRRSGTLRSVRASGNVEVRHKRNTARGNTAVYDPAAATITLTGDARLGSGPSSLEGESVVVYLDEGRTVVEGGEPPHPGGKPAHAGGEAPGTERKGRVRARIDPGSIDTEDLLD